MGAIYKNILNMNDQVDRLYGMTFKDCALTISKMDTMEKSDIAAKVQTKLDSLYASTNQYYDGMFGSPMSTEMFINVMSKIKHYETILYWLYEIDILMEETPLDKLVRAAEKRFENADRRDEAFRFVYKEGEDGKKHRVKVNLREELDTLEAKKIERGNHTEEIMNMAAQLTKKYFK